MATSIYNPGVAELGRKNAADGYVGIDGSGDVLGTFAQRRDTAANIAGIVLKSGELAFTTDTHEAFIGDGTTAGGVFLSQKPQIKRKTYSSLVSHPGLGAETDETSIRFPIAQGQMYKLSVLVNFLAETGDASNFALTVFTASAGSPISIVSDAQIVHETWTSRSTQEILEERIFEATAFSGLSGLVLDLGSPNLALAEAMLKVEMLVYVQTLYSPYLTVTPTPRSGSTSPADCQMAATLQRVE